MNDVRVDRSVTIPADELNLEFTTSSGPGGQHANRASTRAVLSWNVTSSRALTERQKDRLVGALRHRLTASGVLRLASETHRSQMLNRKEVLDRLARIVGEALRPRRRRITTVPSQRAKNARVRAKQHRSEVKKLRRRVSSED